MKKVISFFLCIVICISFIPVSALAAGSSSRDTSFEETLAADLKNLGLFKGVSDTDFDLDRAPSRTEALVMLIRVLGKESEATGGNWTHPFTDVVGWADKYVGYAYANGLTNGVSATEFGTGTASANMYLTFVLRALGYSDTGGADFTWDSPFTLAESIGILPDCVNTRTFWRADVVLVSYAALPVTLKASTQTLAQKLIAAGAFTQAQYDAYYDEDAIDNYMSSAGKTELTSEQVYTKCSPAVFYIELYNSKGTATGSASGFFIDSSGTAVTNFHVIDGAYAAKVTVSGTGKTYDVLGIYAYSEEEDWAVIKVDGSGFSYLNIGSPSTVVGGATVYAIGSPLGLQSTISQGIISNPTRVEGGVTYIQTSAAISAGSSGGALINKYGDVVGITTASYIDGQNLNLAIPTSYVEIPSLSSYQTLSEFYSLHPADPISTIGKFLMKYGTYGVTEGTPYYTVVMTTSDSTYYIDYFPNENSVVLGEEYVYTSYDSIYAFINLDSVSSTYEFFTMEPYESAAASGYLTAATFNYNSTLSFSDYTGDLSYQSDFNDLSVAMLFDLLLATEYMFRNFGIQASIADFGFTSAYEYYNENYA